MGLVRMWSRQVARAAGASLIAPLVLLLAAGVVASGGGLGGLDSLRQITSGPSLPDTGLPRASRSSIREPEIVDAGPPAGETRAAAPPAAQIASATPPAPGPPAAAAAARRQTKLGSRTERSTGGPPGGEGVLLDEPERNAPPPGPETLQETTQGLGEALGEPLEPVTNQLLDLLRLLLPPPR